MSSSIIMECEICGITWNMVNPPICAFCRYAVDRKFSGFWDEEE